MLAGTGQSSQAWVYSPLSRNRAAGAAESLCGKAGRVDIACIHHKDLDGKDGNLCRKE